ncbi:hypothetical protein NOF04DRAFT_17901 [Fusarium oxysporum II5]|uniref:Heterokaryon incompatibility domain-containing protein n=2 Tax=Fusarium oxysporum species complex TaxID=171631 RepID=X0J516_FUSO5|nr:uncharacterized protein FOIG_15418 [Fusarium odoratissimum NRRL 54006]EXL91380.1 hypothetical protein FOIG_15418 [Fusarium odoratissimum NRRL 54006]KAK2130545.1 hypothetical protein NOF04DRAFT_17901 [Fusarium oxysporum II5]TXC09010.1 hypothetical protein FocTR4_00004382 [Fusarium oxysporum f. sp. cubense]
MTLSYMWGNPSVTQPITVDDDKTFPATASLQTALRHLRFQDGVRRLWVDAPPAEWQLDGSCAQREPHILARSTNRVHARLALIINYEGDSEVWSYEESLAEKYTCIAWLLIFKCNSLRFLADVKLTEKSDPTVIGLPSWVPNWNPPGNAAFFHTSFRAAGDIPMLPYPLGGHMEEKILNARGF